MEGITEEPEKKLSEKEMIIIHARIKNPSWSKAKCYQQGYPKSNLNSAYSSSTQFFKKPHIVEFMETRRKEIEEKIDIDAQYVLKRLMRIIEFNPQCMVDKDGLPLPLHKLFFMILMIGGVTMITFFKKIFHIPRNYDNTQIRNNLFHNKMI